MPEPIDSIIHTIQSLQIQGATNVALATLDAIGQIIQDDPTISVSELQEISKALAWARPTEPLAQNAVRYLFDTNTKNTKQVKSRIRAYVKLLSDAKQAIVDLAPGILTDGGVYLTLCHSSTTVSFFTHARSQGVSCSIYVAETRPLFQGRITATELLEAGFEDVTMVIDDVAVSLLEGRKGAIDAVFLGADALYQHGFVNKVGSLAIANAALRAHIPVYILTTLLKFDPRPFRFDVIEQRSSDEIWREAPATLSFYAPAFDFVPYHEYVQVVTEKGPMIGKAVASQAKHMYPSIFQNL